MKKPAEKKTESPVQRMIAAGKKMMEARVPVVIAATGDTLYVRRMDMPERTAFEMQFAADTPSGEVRDNPCLFKAGLLRSTVYNEDGTSAFAGVEYEDIMAMPSELTEPLLDAAMRLAGFTRADREVLEKK